MFDMNLRSLPAPIEEKRRKWRGAQDHSVRAWKEVRDARSADLQADLATRQTKPTNEGASR